MSNPNDPRNPMYQGQALQGRQPQFGSVPPASRLNFLEGAMQLALGAYQLFGGGDDREEGEEEVAPRRRPRSRFARASSGSCCAAKRPTKP